MKETRTIDKGLHPKQYERLEYFRYYRNERDSPIAVGLKRVLLSSLVDENCDSMFQDWWGLF